MVVVVVVVAVCLCVSGVGWGGVGVGDLIDRWIRQSHASCVRVCQWWLLCLLCEERGRERKRG